MDKLRTQWNEKIKKKERKQTNNTNITIDNLINILIQNNLNVIKFKELIERCLICNLEDNYKWIDKDRFNQLLKIPETVFFKYLIKSMIKVTNNKSLVKDPLECLIQFTDISDKQKLKKIIFNMLKDYEKDLDRVENILLKL